jgi:hypothetical protein
MFRWKKVRPCIVHKLTNLLKLGKVCGLDGISNDFLRHLPKRPLIYFTHLFNHCLRLSDFPKPWKETKVLTLPTLSKDPRFPQNLCPISLLSTAGKLFEKVFLKIFQRHTEERGLHIASQIGFRAHHSVTFQCMRLTEHVTLNFNNNMSTAVLFLNIEEAFDTAWHFTLLYTRILSVLKLSISLLKLISSFPFLRKFKVLVEGEMSTTRPIQPGCHMVSSCSPYSTAFE